LRNVGGLSIDRLATILMLYQVLRAFHSRPEPGNLRAGIERIETEADKGHRFGQRILDVLEQLRQNRIKQLASRLVEAALGIGSENRAKHWEGKRKAKRPRRRIEEAQFMPCHAVVAENLENYRPEQARLRSENRRLRDWAARNVRKYIMEGCQLNGLYFDEVSANYTSRQDSRTGAPGVRCNDVSVSEFLKWTKLVEAAQKKIAADGEASHDKLVVALHSKWSAGTDDECKNARPLRIPRNGGEVFVSADPKSPAASGIQADMNAAANIGLKALMDPDWPGAWWYVPVKYKEGRSDSKDFPACPFFERPLQLLAEKDVANESDGKDSGKTREKVNAWSDVSAEPFEGRRFGWTVTPQYWKAVEKRVISGVLAAQQGVSLRDD
jgi:hypothetical protein